MPGKNTRPLAGKPLIRYTIEAALDSKLDRVIVSTEDERIASLARDFGAEVPFLRPEELATDEASSLSVLLHCLKHIEGKEKFFPDVVAFLQPTSPFRTGKHIEAGLDMLQKSGVDSVIGVCEVEPSFHPYSTYEKDENDNLREFIEIQKKPLRSQDFPKLYRLNDALFISRRRYFDVVNEYSPCFNPKSVKGIVMDRVSSISIDDEFDFLLAEFVVRSELFKSKR